MFLQTDKSRNSGMDAQMPQHCAEAHLYSQYQPIQDHSRNFHVEQDQNHTFSFDQNYESLPFPTHPWTNNVPHGNRNSVPPILTNWLPMNDTPGYPELEELEEFAQTFKKKRLSLGFSPGKVVASIVKFYGKTLSQAIICQFENLDMSFTKMCELKPWLKMWLKDASISLTVSIPNMSSMSALLNTSEPIVKKRRPRTVFRKEVRAALEKAFTQDPQLSTAEMVNLSQNLGMKAQVVKVWFFNRRHKEKQMVGLNGARPQKRVKYNFGTSAHITLATAYNDNSRPTSEQMDILAESLGMDLKIIRYWFYKRRRDEKRWTLLRTKGITN